ncbi:unnamed protein product [Meloidogyne enterolobii]|uniref:Uncharacterized protein n=1 Tax=Meloidogyne enterolobii TaxID=390850 RepID=A0ACB0Y818_MELEN
MLENVLKLEKESLAAVENELAKLKIQVDQQLNEYNLKRDEILGLVLNGKLWILFKLGFLMDLSDLDLGIRHIFEFNL